MAESEILNLCICFSEGETNLAGEGDGKIFDQNDELVSDRFDLRQRVSGLPLLQKARRSCGNHKTQRRKREALKNMCIKLVTSE
jgi:hypothetical protein